MLLLLYIIILYNCKPNLVLCSNNFTHITFARNVNLTKLVHRINRTTPTPWHSNNAWSITRVPKPLATKMPGDVLIARNICPWSKRLASGPYPTFLSYTSSVFLPNHQQRLDNLADQLQNWRHPLRSHLLGSTWHRIWLSSRALNGRPQRPTQCERNAQTETRWEWQMEHHRANSLTTTNTIYMPSVIIR